MITRRFTLTSAAALLTAQFLPNITYAEGRPIVVRVPITFTSSGMPLIKLMLNGKGPYTFLIDTGAAFSGIRESLAQELGLHQSGSIHISSVQGLENASIYAVYNIVIGGGLPLSKMDFTGMEKFPFKDVDGMVSATFLTALPSQLDYENKEIRYYLNGAEMDLAGFHAVPALYQADKEGGTQNVYVEITIGGKKLLCELDTGASSTVLVGSTFVARNKLWDAYPVITSHDGLDATGTTLKMRQVQASDMTMGDIHLDKLPATLMDPKSDDNLNSDQIDGLVGTPFLSKFTLAFSGKEKIYFRPNAEYVLATGTMPDLDIPETPAPGTGVIPFLYGEARKILVPGYIGDKPTFPCILDTGSGVSAITPEQAAAQGLPTLSDGNFDGGGLTFGTVRLPHLKLKSRKTAGTLKTQLGLDFLTSLPTQIDFEKNLLTFYIAADPDLTGYTKIGAVREVRDKSGEAKLYVTVKLDGLTTQCRIDTGYPMGIFLPSQTVKSRILWDIFPDAQNRLLRSDTGVITRTRFVVMKGLEIAGTTIDKVPVSLGDPTQTAEPDDQVVDAVIGMGILHRFGIIFDKAGNVWFKPNRFIAG